MQIMCLMPQLNVIIHMSNSYDTQSNPPELMVLVQHGPKYSFHPDDTNLKEDKTKE